MQNLHSFPGIVTIGDCLTAAMLQSAGGNRHHICKKNLHSFPGIVTVVLLRQCCRLFKLACAGVKVKPVCGECMMPYCQMPILWQCCRLLQMRPAGAKIKLKNGPFLFCDIM
eukprot:1161917-Pelagomonas_calceolata.AAC.5